MRSAVFLLIVLSAAACAKKTVPAAPSTPPAVDLAPADALVEAGCYRCLTQAYEIYERALQSSNAPPRARHHAFTTALLLALREKEVGLAAIPWLDRASALARPEERVYLDIAASLSWAAAGPAVDFEASRPRPAERAAWRALLESRLAAISLPGPANEVRYPILDQYLLVALACADSAQRLSEIERQVDVSRQVIRYRVGICGASMRQHLEAVVKADARFVEALFFIGRYEMASGVSPSGPGLRPSRAWLTTAVPPLLAAHQALPEAPIITTVFAGLMRSRGDLRGALALYDDALAARPTQRDALLGRTITLTYLARHAEAIGTASRMIELGTWYIGSAYYWRAHNRYYSSQLESAAADVAAARGLLVNDDVLTLSGMIAYDQKRPRDARADFNAAIALNPSKCIAHWHLGVMDLDDEVWPRAVASFSTAGTCYQAAADSLREEARQLPPDLPEDARRQQMVGFQEGIDSGLRQAGRSFLNAALAALKTGDRAGALGYARSATGYAEVKERADSIARSLETR